MKQFIKRTSETVDDIRMGGVVLEDRGELIMYTCYTCYINFKTTKCPRCGKKGTPIYKDQILERPKNNPTDINAFFERTRRKFPSADCFEDA